MDTDDETIFPNRRAEYSQTSDVAENYEFTNHATHSHLSHKHQTKASTHPSITNVQGIKDRFMEF